MSSELLRSRNIEESDPLIQNVTKTVRKGKGRGKRERERGRVGRWELGPKTEQWQQSEEES